MKVALKYDEHIKLIRKSICQVLYIYIYIYILFNIIIIRKI